MAEERMSDGLPAAFGELPAGPRRRRQGFLTLDPAEPAGFGVTLALLALVVVGLVFAVLAAVSLLGGSGSSAKARSGAGSPAVGSGPGPKESVPRRPGPAGPLTLEVPARVKRGDLVEIRVQAQAGRKVFAQVTMPEELKLPPGEQLEKEFRSGVVRWRARAVEPGKVKVRVQSGAESATADVEILPEN